MPTPDEALAALQAISVEFAAFCAENGAATEADTRAKVIDRILKEVCGWPEASISREPHVRRDSETGVEHGYIDYCLQIGSKAMLAVEAKREGTPFIFPVGGRRNYSLDGALVSDENIKIAVYQARGYCDDQGIRFAIATNGYAWIAFRAVRDDVPWRKGLASVFTGIPDIQENITEFLNLLSYEAISKGSLQEAFSPTTRASRHLHRVIDHLHDPDLPLQRNQLDTAIQPLIKLIFDDIADQDQLDVLRACYVHVGSLTRAANDLDRVFSELIPQFLVNAGARPVGLPQAEGGFESVLAHSMNVTKGELFLLLGGIGSGKSTFLKRYQRSTGARVLEEKTLWFAIDFKLAPLDPIELEPFVWSGILSAIQNRYGEKGYERRRFLNDVFAPQINALESTILENVKQGTSKYSNLLSPFIHEWQKDLRTYVPALVQISCRREHRIPVLFIDNVDQLSPPYQAQIFLLAQRVCQLVGAVTIVALREESYYTASVQRSFTAFSSRKFLVASPWFRQLIRSRINFAIRELDKKSLHEVARAAEPDDWVRISNFLHIVKNSIFGGDNRNIVRFIEAVCFGNMRLALRLFSTFLYSGATNVRKMLTIFERDGRYDVPFHEFLKSIMLGDRAYYKEDASELLNMFNVGTQKNSSHFTAFRVLRTLMTHRRESTREGRGYVRLEVILNSFEDVFDNRDDLLSVLDRLVRYRLVEANTRSSETIAGASHVRVTSAGWFHVRFLTKTFAYLDLVLQDTPVDDYAVHRQLFQSVRDVDNLADREDEKLLRVRTRFERVSTFIDYLQAQESAERSQYGLTEEMGVLGEEIVPPIRLQFDRERAWIERRIIENLERYNDEDQFTDPDNVEQFLLREYVETYEETEEGDVEEGESINDPA